MRHIKITCFLLLVSFCVHADTWTDSNGLTWSYELEDGSAVIQGVTPSPSGQLAVPSMLGGHAVTGIGNSVFANCIGLTSVTIPNSVTNIGDYAFHGCTNIVKITWPGELGIRWAFADIDAEEGFVIPYANKSIKTLVIAEGSHHIADFNGVSSISNVVIADSVTSIGELAFADCSGLTSVTIPNSVTNIGDSAFYHCNGLTSVTIGNCVKRIEYAAFEGCSGLTRITIPKSVTVIDNYAFSWCDNLTSVNMPRSLEGCFDASVFEGCPASLAISYYDDLPVSAPMNDHFVNACDFGSASGWSGSNVGATAETGEPLINRWSGATTTVWCVWMASANGTATFDTVGSSFDTVIGVYTGYALDNLSVVAEDDDGGGNSASAVTFTATEGATYYICIAGWSGATGDISLNCRFTTDTGDAVPPAVLDLTATDDGPVAIRVGWSIVSGATVSGYRVYRATRNDFSRAVCIADLTDGCSLSYADLDVSVDPTYYYWVIAYNDNGESEVTGPVTGYCEEPIQITTTNLPNATELVDYEATLSAEHDTGYLQWCVEWDDAGHSGLPSGMELSSEGVLSGCPTQHGNYSFTVCCYDSRFGGGTTAQISIMVGENANRKPTVSASDPAIGTDVVLVGGESQRFSVTASDPEGLALTYVWMVDGQEVQRGSKNYYCLRMETEEVGNSHEVICYVNDNLWTNIVSCNWLVYVAKEIYVDAANGSDDNDGSSTSAAFETLNRALLDVAPYDTIHVAPGTYHEDVYLWCPVSLIATAGAAQTVIDRIDRGGAVIENTTDDSYSGQLKIQGFTLRNGVTTVCNATLEQCVITGCGAEGAPMPYWDGEGEPPEPTPLTVLDGCTLERCTVAGNETASDVALMKGCTCDEATIVWGNGSDLDEATDPVFVDVANGDCRLRAMSPYVANGLATRGALGEVATGFVISATVVGPGALDRMTALVEQGGNATFTVMGSSHPLDHFEVDGVRVADGRNDYSFINVQRDAALTVFFVSNVTFYVDAVNGDDAADGFSKATAVATLQEAIDRAVDGDTVLAADGIYAPIHTDGKLIVIESENGYQTTVIDGGGTYQCVSAGGSDYFGYWSNTNTVLRGFTVRNGYAPFGAGCIGGSLERCLITGCTAYWQEPTYTIPYGSGGGAYGSMLVRCTIVGNTAESGVLGENNGHYGDEGGLGGGIYECAAKHCIIWGNTGANSSDSFASDCSDCCFEDPLFADKTNGDWRLLASSIWVVADTAIVGCEEGVAAATAGSFPYNPGNPWYLDFVVWAYDHGFIKATEMTDEERVKAVATTVGAKGYPTWHDYVAGIDPADTDMNFRADISIDGENVLIGWIPRLSADEEAKRVYTIYGCVDLPRTDRDWVRLDGSHEATDFRLFKVRVEMGSTVQGTAGTQGRTIVVFNANGADEDTARIAKSGVAIGDLPTPTRTGYTFDGWYTAASGGSRVTCSTVMANVPFQTYYAHWTANVYTIRFDPNGGRVETSSKSVRYGSAYGELPTPICDDYVFSGWYTEANGGVRVIESDVMTTDSSHALYAHWVQAAYCVIDLSQGSTASTYPVKYLCEPPEGGFNTTEYKTTKLVLRRIPAGSFKLGGTDDVTVDMPFYIGIFEVTQRQYQLVTGATPSEHEGAIRPVENVSWTDVRGNTDTGDWTTIGTISPSSFIGLINAKTGLACDLPTYVQWEYACRAGTTSMFNNGGNTEEDLKQLGRCQSNTNDGKGGYSEHTAVGSYLSNAWGLYDMHGNVWEFSLNVSDEPGTQGVMPSGYYSLVRGGGWQGTWGGCSSKARVSDKWVHQAGGAKGFRLLRTLEP